MSTVTHAKRVTPNQLMKKKSCGEKIISLTAYDYGTAKILDATGLVDIILVGDSLGMVMLGYPDTLSVTMEDMLHHAKAVARGAQHAMVVVDMPFMSVHVSVEPAVANAGRVMQEGMAQAVKLEGATALTLETVRHLTQIGIPVMGHLGLTPQSIQTLGGYKLQAKSVNAVEQLVNDARALEEAGAFAVVLEMVPVEAAALVSQVIRVPTIGIGAGPSCDGQILVLDDFMGKFPDFKPRFVRQYADFAQTLHTAVRQYTDDVECGRFPAMSESSAFPQDELADLQILATRFLGDYAPRLSKVSSETH